jgi:hypothetical protein
MRVVTVVRKVLGTIFSVACFGLAIYALVRLVQGGSCGSGGNYISVRPCPPGTGRWAAALPLGIFGGLLFLGLGYIRFGRAKQTRVKAHPRLAPNPAAQMFTTGGARPNGWPSHVPWPLTAVDGQHAFVMRMSGGEPGAGTQAPGAPATDQDPLSRLERLRALRDADALTAAEYDEAKAKILSQM